MGVEIIILSGSRQGQQLELDVDEFRAGGDSSCDIFFDPAADAAAAGRAALFQRTDEGWCIRNVGPGELLLNQQAVSGRRRIRSGDIVRLSDRGPDFSFEITSGRALPADPPVKSATAESTPVLCNSKNDGAGATAGLSSSVIGTAGQASSGTHQNGLAPITPPQPSKRTVLIAVGASVGILTLAGLLALVLLAPGENAEPLAGPVPETPAVVEPGEQKPLPPPVENGDNQVAPSAAQTDKSNAHTDNTTAGTSPSTTQSTAPKDPWEAIARRHAKTVWLLRVGDADGKFVYPFATAFAVGDHMLMTSGCVAEELDKFRAKGWTIMATNAAMKKTVPVGKIRVHGVFSTFAGNPKEQIYVDVAVLETEQGLGPTMTPASEAELAELDTGDELACMGIAHGGDAMKAEDAARRDSLPPRLFHGKLFLKTRLDPKLPAGPRLLHLKASLGENMQGSPIINRRGNVVAVYAEAAAAGEGHRLGLHYAPILNPALIQQAIDGKHEKFWVPPARKKPEKNNKK